MAEEDNDQKTEQPTSKRLSEAEEKGQYAISREVSHWLSFVTILVIVAYLAPGMIDRLMVTLRVLLETPQPEGIDDRELQTLLLDCVLQVGLATGVIFLLMNFSNVIGTGLQTGFAFSLERIRPDFERLMPSQGLKRLFSMQALVEFFKSLLKFLFLGTVVFCTLWPLMNEMANLSMRPMMDSVMFLFHQMVHMIIVLTVVYAVIAIGDTVYQRYQYIKNLKMTKTEVKDEHKQQEGDPMIKGRLRQMRLERARKRMMSQVPKADVIITNPTHYAVALQYDGSKMAAPVVLAKGINLIAEKIKEIATENNIPTVSNPPLSRALYDTVEIDHPISTEHYKAVAEVISYVYKLKKRK